MSDSHAYEKSDFDSPTIPRENHEYVTAIHHLFRQCAIEVSGHPPLGHKMIAKLVDSRGLLWRIIALMVMMLLLIAFVENPRVIQKRYHPPIADPGQDKKESLVVSFNDIGAPPSADGAVHIPR